GRVPAALFVVDITQEPIAVAEAKRLGMTTFAMVDTNSDPSKDDFAIPANDDATKSIAIITQYLTAAIMEGLEERATSKEDEEHEDDEDSSKERGVVMTVEEEGGRRGGGDRKKPAGGAAGGGRQGSGAR